MDICIECKKEKHCGYVKRTTCYACYSRNRKNQIKSESWNPRGPTPVELLAMLAIRKNIERLTKKS